MHRSPSLCSKISKLEALNMSAQNCVSWLFSVCFLCWPVLWMPEEKVKEGEVSTKFYNFLAKQISRKYDYYWRFYSNFLVNTNKANISEKINLKLVGRKSLRRRGGNKFLFCPTTKNFKPIGVFLTILEALSCKTKYRKYLAKYPFPGIHICLTYFQYCNNEPDIPKSSIKQLWNLDPRYTSISPRSAIESYEHDHQFRRPVTAPSNGPIEIKSGDFGASETQTIGYPGFVSLENSVPMPLGRGDLVAR